MRSPRKLRSGLPLVVWYVAGATWECGVWRTDGVMLPGRYRQNISNETLRDARDDSSNQPPELVEQVVIKSTRYTTTNITPSIFTGRFCITRTEKNDWINVTIIIILSKYLLIIFFYNSTCIKYCKVINNFSYFMTTILLFPSPHGFNIGL